MTDTQVDTIFKLDDGRFVVKTNGSRHDRDWFLRNAWPYASVMTSHWWFAGKKRKEIIEALPYAGVYLVFDIPRKHLIYVGCTSDSIGARLRQHINQATRLGCYLCHMNNFQGGADLAWCIECFAPADDSNWTVDYMRRLERAAILGFRPSLNVAEFAERKRIE